MKYGQIFDEEDELENKKPYDTISSREPIANPRGENAIDTSQMQPPQSPMGENPMAQMISQRMQGRNSATAPQFPSPTHIPSYQSPDADMVASFGGNPQSDDLRFAQSQAPGGNFYLAGTQLAAGANKPSGQNDLGKALNHENEMRNRVMQAMQARSLAAGKQAQTQNNFERNFSQRERNLSERHKKNEQIEEDKANAFYSKETGQYTQMLDSAIRLEDVLSKVKSGELKSASNVVASITNDISQLLTNSKNTSVSDREHAKVNALSKTWADFKNYALSHADDTLPPVYLAQFEQELDLLKDSVAQAYKRKTNELKTGTQSSKRQGVFENRYNSQMGAHARPEPSPSPTPSPEPTTPEKEDMVRVVHPQKGAFKVPRSNLKKAIKRGYQLNE